MFGEGEGDVRVCEGEGTLVGVLFVESIADQGNSTSSLDQSKGFPTRSSRLKNVHNEDPVNDIRQHQ